MPAGTRSGIMLERSKMIRKIEWAGLDTPCRASGTYGLRMPIGWMLESQEVRWDVGVESICLYILILYYCFAITIQMWIHVTSLGKGTIHTQLTIAERFDLW